MKQGTLLTRIVVAILFVAIVAYIIAAGIYHALNPYDMETAYWATHEERVPVNAWIFRDETQLPAASGLINLRLDEGDRIAAGKTLAVVYQSQEALSRQQELRELSSQVTQLFYAKDDGSISGSSLEDEVSNQLAQLRVSASSGDFSALADQADVYKRLILRREYLSSDDASAALGQALVTLQQEQEALQNTAQGEYTEITSPCSGYYTAHADGYESLLLPAALEQMTTESFLSLVQQTPPSPDPAILGRVVTSSRWKMAFALPAEDANRFRVGNQVEVRLSSSADTVPMAVERISLPEKEQSVVVLTSDENLQAVLSLRNVSCSVVFSSTEGIWIAKEALRVEDDQPGVYTLTGYRAEFKPVKVLAEGEDYYIVAAAPKNEEDERILRSGDEVIIAAADLYDGKVVQ